ncbi:hypothetical protein BLOT_003499 [Blomia tropicalis]|nr:hypothetical protein BLOT_003499 [Blomia tropicalis]
MIKNKTHKSVSNVSETFHYYKSIRNAVSTERNNPNFIYNDNGIYATLLIIIIILISIILLLLMFIFNRYYQSNREYKLFVPRIRTKSKLKSDTKKKIISTTTMTTTSSVGNKFSANKYSDKSAYTPMATSLMIKTLKSDETNQTVLNHNFHLLDRYKAIENERKRPIPEKSKTKDDISIKLIPKKKTEKILNKSKL